MKININRYFWFDQGVCPLNQPFACNEEAPTLILRVFFRLNYIIGNKSNIEKQPTHILLLNLLLNAKGAG